MIHFYILTGLIDGAGPVTVAPPEPIPTRAGGGGGKAFRVKSNRQASPYRDTVETAAELAARATIESVDAALSAATLEAADSDIVGDIPPPSEARKPASRKAERSQGRRDIFSDTEAAQTVMAQALRGVEAQLRAAIAAQDIDEDEAIALVLILAEA